MGVLDESGEEMGQRCAGGVAGVGGKQGVYVDMDDSVHFTGSNGSVDLRRVRSQRSLTHLSGRRGVTNAEGSSEESVRPQKEMP